MQLTDEDTYVHKYILGSYMKKIIHRFFLHFLGEVGAVSHQTDFLRSNLLC